MSNPGRKNFLTKVGATFKQTLQYGSKVNPDDPNETLTPIDITGYDFRMQVRDGFGSGATLILDLKVSTGGIIIVDATEGIIEINVSKTVMAMKTAGKYKYDLVAITPDGDADPWMFGCFEIDPTSTIIT